MGAIKGKPQRNTIKKAKGIREIIREGNYDPIKELIAVSKLPDVDPKLRMDVAKALLPYVYGTPRPMDDGESGQGRGIFNVSITVGANGISNYNEDDEG
jgi:hypothetical protein